MATTRTATAQWEGSLMEGAGRVSPVPHPDDPARGLRPFVGLEDIRILLAEDGPRPQPGYFPPPELRKQKR